MLNCVCLCLNYGDDMQTQIHKYPRTFHIEGSNAQFGDVRHYTPFSELKDHHVVLEEKVDGANAAISFSKDGELLLQSRGHYLTGGGREKHFNLFKSFSSNIEEKLFNILGDRFIIYGEWLYGKHSIFYDQLPAYFMEFDILDTENNYFLDTASRQKLLEPVDELISVRILHSGFLQSYEHMDGAL